MTSLELEDLNGDEVPDMAILTAFAKDQFEPKIVFVSSKVRGSHAVDERANSDLGKVALRDCRKTSLGWSVGFPPWNWPAKNFPAKE